MKKTHEEYVKELAIKNPNIAVIENYVNANTSILHKCKIHNIEWKAIPTSILRGSGCIKCGIEKTKVSLVKSHDQYVLDLKNKNPDIIVIEDYVNTSTSILHKCLIDGYEWKAKPNNILNGTGCPICSGSKRRTHEEYKIELAKVNPNIEVVENYITINTPIKHYCKKHNIIWNVLPSSVLMGCGCSQCGKEKIGNKFRKSSEQYIDDVKFINPHISVIGKYRNTSTRILHKCEKHNITWKTSPNSILQGCGCIECWKEKQRKARGKGHDKYVQQVKTTNPNIEVIEQYVNSNTPILHKCLIDNCEWNSAPSNILSGHGCPMCAGNKHKSQEEYIKEVKLINPDIEVVGEYVNFNTPILHKCLIDGYEWYTRPEYIISGRRGCPKCNESSGERQVRQWLEKNNIKYEYQKRYDDCKDINTLPFDFYLPTYNLIVEYDDKQHFEPIEYFGGIEAFNTRVKHDNIKNEYCKNNGISLLRIPYYKNVEEELNNFLFI